MLILKFSVTVDGERKEGTISYELPQKPLFACLLEHELGDLGKVETSPVRLTMGMYLQTAP